MIRPANDPPWWKGCSFLFRQCFVLRGPQRPASLHRTHHFFWFLPSTFSLTIHSLLPLYLETASYCVRIHPVDTRPIPLTSVTDAVQYGRQSGTNSSQQRFTTPTAAWRAAKQNLRVRLHGQNVIYGGRDRQPNQSHMAHKQTWAHRRLRSAAPRGIAILLQQYDLRIDTGERSSWQSRF